MTTQDKEIRILFIEDLPSDYELATKVLLREGILFTSILVDTENEMLAALEDFKPHAIISDYTMPRFNGMEALKICLDRNPEIPFILLTGSINEETAVECMKVGAADYVLKERIKRLPFALKEAIEHTRIQTLKKKADIELKKSEERYRNIFENSPTGIYRTTPDGKILLANPSLIKMLGYRSFEDLSNRNLNNSGFEPSYPRADFIKQIETYGMVKGFESEWRLQNGNSIFVIESARAVRNENGETIYYEGMVEDITDRKIAELEIMAKNYEIETQNEEYRTLNEELLKAKEKAEESDRLKTAFLQNLSHEIRTPMNGIMGFTNLLKEKLDNPILASQYLDVIEKSGDRLMNLISDLVDISKIEAGVITISQELFSVNEMLTGLKGFFSIETKKKDLQIEVNQFLPEKYDIILCDKEKIFQTLSNLIKNSVKFTETGSITIGCTAKNNELEFRVQDTGIGIEPQNHEMIFERFMQADTSLSRGYEGVGLGLSISKAYIEALGGRIWVESELGKGATFIFTIPYKVQESEITNLTVMENGNDFIDKNLKALVVEDDVVSRMLLQEILRECDTNITFARNGKEAVGKVKEDQSFDFILMDLKMPIMNGYEATEKIRELGFTNPIIAQTAYASIEDKTKIHAGGFNAYLSKPLTKTALMQVIKEFFGK